MTSNKKETSSDSLITRSVVLKTDLFSKSVVDYIQCLVVGCLNYDPVLFSSKEGSDAKKECYHPFLSTLEKGLSMLGDSEEHDELSPFKQYMQILKDSGEGGIDKFMQTQVDEGDRKGDSHDNYVYNSMHENMGINTIEFFITHIIRKDKQFRNELKEAFNEELRRFMKDVFETWNFRKKLENAVSKKAKEMLPFKHTKGEKKRKCEFNEEVQEKRVKKGEKEN